VALFFAYRALASGDPTDRELALEIFNARSKRRREARNRATCSADFRDRVGDRAHHERCACADDDDDDAELDRACSRA
jgi:hypothetical protein